MTIRKLLIILAVLFTTTVFAAIGAEAFSASQHARSNTMSKHRMMTSKSSSSKKMSMRARIGRGAMKCPTHCKCAKHVKRHRVMRKKSMPAKAARGPVVTCPTPVINIPQQPAPVVNVPQQPAPVVNVPTVGITVDANQIYIVRENQLYVMDKCTFEVKKVVPLQ